MRQRRGFTFIELMITMLFMAIAYFFIMDLYRVLIVRIQTLEIQDVAVDLCNFHMEKTKNSRMNMATMLGKKETNEYVSFKIDPNEEQTLEVDKRAINTKWRIRTTYQPYVPGLNVVQSNPDQMVLIRVSAIRQTFAPGDRELLTPTGEFVEFELTTLYQDVKPQ